MIPREGEALADVGSGAELSRAEQGGSNSTS